jgi:hypothetical protein
VSKREKLRLKLFRTPAPKDFTWEELISLMSQFDFKAHAPAGGSHYTFEHKSGFCFGVSKTHPSGVLKSYQVKEAKEALARVGADR